MNIPTQDQRRDYLERIAYLAYFFFETLEEDGGNGHSEIIKLLNPIPADMGWKELRELILHELLRGGQSRGEAVNITDTAIETAARLRSNFSIQFEADGEEELLRLICSRYEHPFAAVLSKEERLSRCGQRFVRLLWLMYCHDLGRHSRGLDFFFPADEILIGRSHRAPEIGSHKEHVVPCAYIRDEVLNRFETQCSLIQQGQFQEDQDCLQEMNRFIRRLMAVAYIHPEEAKELDAGIGAMKDSMPDGWDPDSGDILARLKVVAKIEHLIPA